VSFPSSALPPLCEAASRALRGRATVLLPDDRAPRAVDAARCLDVTSDDGAFTLRVERAAGDAPWTDDDRALAASLVRLAGATAHAAPSPTVERELRAANERLEQHVAERTAALQRSEEHFRRLIENGSDLLMIAAPDLSLTYASPSVERILGYRPADIIGLRPDDLLHPDDRCGMQEALLRQRAEPGHVARATWRMRHADGSWREFEALARALPEDAPERGFVINGRDVTERRTAQQALQRSEEQFRRMIENGSDLLLIARLDGSLTYASPSAERLLGWTPDQMLAVTPPALLHPEDVTHVLESMRACGAAPGTIRRVVFRVLHRDGGWRLFEALARTLAPDSADLGIVCNGRDVTEQRAAEEALQRSEEHFRALIERSYDLVQVLDPQGRVVYTGPSVERLLGYTPEEIAGGTIPDFMHPEDLPAAAELVGRLLAAPGTEGSLQYRVRHKNGTWRWMEVFARTLSPTSADQGIVANARDITERRQAEVEMRASEERFRALIENAHDLTSISTPDGHIAYMSPSVLRVLGYEPEEIEGEWAMDYIHPDDVAHVQRELARVVGSPSTAGHAEYRFRHKDGSWRLLEAFARTLSRETGAEGLVLNIRDVTERRRTEEALRQAKADAEQAHREAERANRAKSEFLSRMSHELRTPLNSILGFAQVLEDLELPPEYRGGVRHILNGGRHLLNLINEVLDIARIEADEQPMSLEPVRVQAVVREAVDMVRPLAQARGILIAEAAFAVADRYVRADRQRLTQVLLNLLSNAVKYNRPRGEVRIDGEIGRDADGAERVRVRVHDQGAGIAPEQRDQLFVPFARLGAERTGVEGTGLGLALSQRLTRAMAGALFLERSGPEGSVFTVELPATANPLADAPTLVARAGRPSAAPRVPATLLYVEDNLANLTLVETVLLPRPEWRLIPALQGRLGIELARQHAPDLILLDLHLPDMHGAEVLRHLRADPRTAQVPVVVISADATPRTIEALTADGAEAFLTKPLDVRAFVHTVERLLARAARGA
jgi:PAS domain S-box-containing protein